MEIKNKSIIVFTLVLLISIMGISAFGVGCAYSNENPLKLSPGESSEVLINLQNDEEIQLKASILEGADITGFLEATDVYTVPANGKINARLEVSIPSDANIGEEKIVTLNFQQISESQGGTVGFNTAMRKSFKVIVVEKPPVETPATEEISLIWWMLGIIVVVALIIVIWFVAKGRKE